MSIYVTFYVTPELGAHAECGRAGETALVYGVYGFVCDRVCAELGALMLTGGGTDRGLLAERVGNALRLAALEYYAAALDCAAAPLDYAAAARGQNHTTQAQAAMSGGAGARQVPNPWAEETHSAQQLVPGGGSGGGSRDGGCGFKVGCCGDLLPRPNVWLQFLPEMK
eukprot:CAMPEP_0181186204 /NCGR_PEP_ID=MMETSP1096-20121128/9912_1 /TAXON_ID=156174 ORGANISM="Chrysochromulina ericina, Strain CCMP281" /NCGR_SAMPLE_ID=MMETSP1096 /ASSEMBLY_ACC=CAM_ASM_000453 /LENGTH=167 /DNA_ID=CAMNT_0023275091 /DNA_START=226 /DNA_END=731 /DNA_ORIENTATION=+